VGASYLALKIDSSPATIGRLLQKLDYAGYLKKHSNKGRSLTKRGLVYLRGLYRAFLRDQHSREFIQDDAEPATLEYIQNVLAVRKILESEIIALAAKRISDQEVAELQEIIREHDHKVSLGLPGDEEDLKFHTTLAGLSDNDVLVQILHMILYHKSVYAILTRIRRNAPSPLVVEHKKIVAALAERNAELAVACMRAHIDSITRDVEKLTAAGQEKKGETAS
jgi:DNA-binding FadR family transcriptional regulator